MGKRLLPVCTGYGSHLKDDEQPYDTLEYSTKPMNKHKFNDVEGRDKWC